MTGSGHGLVASRLEAYGAALQQLPGWVHASWQAPLGLVGDPFGAGPHWAAALGLGTVPALAFRAPAHRLAVLPPKLLCRLLRARGLLRRRPALRRCLDGALRARLADWVHPPVFEAVLRESTDELHRDAEGLPLQTAACDACPVDELAWEGFCLFERDRVWSDPHLQRLVRLGFDCGKVQPASLVERPGAPDGSNWVLARLDRFAAEAPWLCG